MNLTPKNYQDELMSDTERNQKLLSVGDKLYSPGSQFWTITELFDEGFEASDERGDKDYFLFDELQTRWDVVVASKKEEMDLRFDNA